MQIHELTALARNSKASDIHISEGLPLMFRIDGHLAEAPVQLSAAETRSLILSLMDEAHREAITSERIDADFALVAPDGTRSRVNVFYQQGRAAATLRLLNDSIPTLEELAMPPVLTKLADEPRGLILVTGPTGSGKSTTLAAMIDHINKTRSDHIITIEDPIEYVYQGRCSLIHQREVGADVRSFASALRSALREDPDVILVGEMRDYETISAAVTAAETGHLVMSTLHTIGAAQVEVAAVLQQVLGVFSHTAVREGNIFIRHHQAVGRGLLFALFGDLGGGQVPAGAGIDDVAVRGVGRAGRVQLGAGTEAGVHKALRFQLFVLPGVDVRAFALVVRPVGAAGAAALVPHKTQPCKVLLQQVRVNARAALGVQILDAQHDAAALAFGTEPGQQAAGQIAQMQPPAGAGRKAPDHSPAHRPSFHCPSSGWKMGVL